MGHYSQMWFLKQPCSNFPLKSVQKHFTFKIIRMEEKTTGKGFKVSKLNSEEKTTGKKRVSENIPLKDIPMADVRIPCRIF